MTQDPTDKARERTNLESRIFSRIQRCVDRRTSVLEASEKIADEVDKLVVNATARPLSELTYAIDLLTTGDRKTAIHPTQQNMVDELLESESKFIKQIQDES